MPNPLLFGAVTVIEDENGVHTQLVPLGGPSVLEEFEGKKVGYRIEVIDDCPLTDEEKKKLGICSYCERAFGSHNPSCPKPD